MADTPRYGHPPIVMVRVPRINWDDDAELGQFAWHIDALGRRSLAVMIPGGKLLTPVFTLWTINHKNRCDAQWAWDGEEDRPTLTPSLHAVGIWHGRVTAGRLVEA